MLRDHGQADLIYCDPPFFTGVKRRGRKGSPSYSDNWPSMESYIAWLRERVVAMRDALSDQACLVLHLDWHAVHYAKVMCDEVFGAHRFVNEIIWAFRTGGTSKRRLARKHDTLLVYSKSKDYAFFPQMEKRYLAHRYGFSNIQVEEDEGGHYRYALMRDVWEMPALRGNQPECSGYPTQKPLVLLERIIELFTEPGALVGDFFCGSGTSAVAALKLGRSAFASDASAEAINVARARLSE